MKQAQKQERELEQKQERELEPEQEPEQEQEQEPEQEQEQEPEQEQEQEPKQERELGPEQEPKQEPKQERELEPEQEPRMESAENGIQNLDKKRRRTILVLSCSAVICAAITVFLLYDYHRTRLQTERALEEIRVESENILLSQPQESASSAPAEAKTPLTENPYASAFLEYPDIQGWLQVEDTVIDYPILQREGEDEYYLYRNFKGENDKSGSLILDEDSSVSGGEFTTNLLIHGHNMKDGSMFGELEEYRSEDYCKEHKYMKLYTRDGEHNYEVIAVFESQVYYSADKVFKYYYFFQADTEEEFDYFYNNIKELSLYDTGVTAEFGDKFLTLSTCAYHVEDGRFVVVAKEIEPEEE